MHYDVFERNLYASLPNEKIVIKIQSGIRNYQQQHFTPENLMNSDKKSYSIVAGVVGKACIGNRICGDGGLATKAFLAYPKVNKLRKAIIYLKQAIKFYYFHSINIHSCNLSCI